MLIFFIILFKIHSTLRLLTYNAELEFRFGVRTFLNNDFPFKKGLLIYSNGRFVQYLEKENVEGVIAIVNLPAKAVYVDFINKKLSRDEMKHLIAILRKTRRQRYSIIH